MLTFWRIAALSALPRGIDGVFEEMRFVGRQYSVAPPDPHGFPVRLSFHFSFCHRLSESPAEVLRTCPLALRHLATACAARADHLPYCCITLL